MKLSFENSLIPESIFNELEFHEYLDLFSTEIPILPDTTLKNLSPQQARDHFDRLTSLEKQLENHHIDLKELLSQSRRLPALDYLLKLFESKQLEAYHLYDLGHFVDGALDLSRLEAQNPLPENVRVCRTIQSILKEVLTDDYSSVRMSSEEEQKHQQIKQIESQISRQLFELEKQVFEQTGYKLVHPFPREVDETEIDREAIKRCKYIKSTEKGNLIQLDIAPGDEILSLETEKETIRKRWQQSIDERLSLLNDRLNASYDAFARYLAARKQRTFDYHLIDCKQKHQLSFPKSDPALRIELQKGSLPALKKIRQASYKPLDITLEPGVNLLFGANMTGKTTVLKTLYFQLTMAKSGLPVPAEYLKLGFPASLAMQLKSSGQIASGLSGFGNEIGFFCDLSPEPSIYLIDELFHSTDPINGVKLTRAFIEGIRHLPSIFFCTSHYPEALTIPGITLFKMKDIESPSDQRHLEDWLQHIPYELERVPETERRSITHADTPLRIALRFPLPKTIRKSIQHLLNE